MVEGVENNEVDMTVVPVCTARDSQSTYSILVISG